MPLTNEGGEREGFFFKEISYFPLPHFIKLLFKRSQCVIFPDWLYEGKSGTHRCKSWSGHLSSYSWMWSSPAERWGPFGAGLWKRPPSAGLLPILTGLVHKPTLVSLSVNDCVYHLLRIDKAPPSPPPASQGKCIQNARPPSGILIDT